MRHTRQRLRLRHLRRPCSHMSHSMSPLSDPSSRPSIAEWREPPHFAFALVFAFTNNLQPATPNSLLNVPPCPQRRPDILRPLGLFRAPLASPSRIRKPPLLVLGLGNHAWHRDRPPLPVYRNIRHVRGGHMAQCLSARCPPPSPARPPPCWCGTPGSRSLSGSAGRPHAPAPQSPDDRSTPTPQSPAQCRTAATAPTRSMNCISRPPNRLPSAFESAGKMISLRSACDSATVRETILASLIPSF